MRTLPWPAQHTVSDSGYMVALDKELGLQYLMVACACLVECSVNLRLHGVKGVEDALCSVQILSGAIEVFKAKLHICACHKCIYICIL